jgi:hypothetical protein
MIPEAPSGDMMKYFVIIWTEEKKILGIIGSCRKGRMIDISVSGCCLPYVPEIDYVSLRTKAGIPGYSYPG